MKLTASRRAKCMSYSQDQIAAIFKPAIIAILCVALFTITVYMLVRPGKPYPPPANLENSAEKAVRIKINSEMNKLFKSCKSDNARINRYVIYNNGQNKQIFELANLSWNIEEEPVEAYNRDYNDITFRGKIRLVRNSPDSPILYRVFEPDNQSWSKDFIPFSAKDEACPASNCVLSVEERNGVLKITSDYYSTLKTECNGVDTPLKPLEVDYLTTEQLADKKIPVMIDELYSQYSCNPNTITGDQEQSVYYFSYIDKQTGEEYVVKTTDIKWELQDKQSKELERVITATAVNISIYKKKPSYMEPERGTVANINEDQLTQTIVVKYVDDNWIVCISGEWTKYPCKKVMTEIETGDLVPLLLIPRW